MASFHEYKRRTLIPLVGIALSLYYVFVYLPIDRRSRELNEPLHKSWRALTASLGQTNAMAVDFLRLTNQLSETKESLKSLQDAKSRAFRRMELSEAIRGKLSANFQLVEYQIARSQQMDALVSLAKAQNVTLEPSVLAGFPEHTVEVTQPELLWASLNMVKGLLTTAMQSKVTAIHSLDAPMILTNILITSASWMVSEIPLQIEITGPAPAVGQFLRSLPFRGDELKTAGFPDAPTDKPPLFIDRLVMKKQGREKADEVHVSLRVVGFVLRE
jgi:hypothetical protein